MLYDRGTGSLWMHLTGACFAGPLAGRRLQPLETGRHTRWAEWRASHPDTDVMRPDPVFVARYFPPEASRAGDPYLSRPFVDTFGPLDPRLPASTLLLGAVEEGAARAWPLDRLEAAGGPVEDEVGGTPVVVLYHPGARSAAVYDRRLDGRTLAFEATGVPGHVRDRETGSTWDLEGAAVAGPLAGRRLRRPPSLQAEWYGWQALHPDTTLWAGGAVKASR